MKYKINNVRHEKWDGTNCGWYCINFILKRTSGHTFIEATKFNNNNNNNISSNEKDIDELRKKYIKFNYI